MQESKKVLLVVQINPIPIPLAVSTQVERLVGAQVTLTIGGLDFQTETNLTVYQNFTT
jgi:hypothetical protein